MTIQAVYFDIPSDIQAALDSGNLSRFGGVVRDAMGHIVEHLKEVPSAGQSQETAGRIVDKLKNPWAVAAVGLGVAAAGGVTLLVARKRNQTSRSVEGRHSTLRAYLEAIRGGSLDADIISRLISDLDAVEQKSDDGSITDFSTEQSEKLVAFVAEYTRKLADANAVELSAALHSGRVPTNDPVVDLRRHLEAQRRIFSRAA